jgi:FkbM family methyltransferase
MIQKIKNSFKYLIQKYFFKDNKTAEFYRWFKDEGDQNFRLNYPLNIKSVVFDLGGYHGDFAFEINQKYGCQVYLFEPVPEFYEHCLERFKNNKLIHCFNFGLSAKNEYLNIFLDKNASSFLTPTENKSQLKVEVRSVTEFINYNKISLIDLFKINIEGGEFEVMPELINTGDILKIKFIQIQFHSFINNAESMRNKIRQDLKLTHNELWNYEFVWESWKSKVDE